jgi:hypothetical protein
MPTRRVNASYSFNFEGVTYRATISQFPDGRLAELFLDVGKAGSALQEHASTAAVLASILLQHGVDVEAIKHSCGGPLAVALEHFGKPQVLQ